MIAPPGLIDLHRYPVALSSHGIATFLQRPVGLTPADLRAAEVDVAMVGAGMDFSGGMRGAAFALVHCGPTTCTCPPLRQGSLTRM